MIRYANTLKEEITQQQASALVDYYKQYYSSNNTLEKEDYINSGKSEGIIYYNNNSESHSNIIANNLLPHHFWINIKETSVLQQGYTLTTIYSYNSSGLRGKELNVYDPNGDMIGSELQDENGVPDYSQTSKYYWNRARNEKSEVFECRFDEAGNLLGIYWYEEPNDPWQQTGFWLHNTPDDIQKLQQLTRLSMDMINYYLIPNIIPSFTIL